MGPRGFERATLFAAVTLASGCSAILGIHDLPGAGDGGGDGGEDGTTGDSSASEDTGRPEATGAQDACARSDAGAGLGVLGCPCSSPGSLACNGHAQPVTLICSGGVWTKNQTCPQNQLCDSRAGQCAQIDPLCAGGSPGQDVCSDEVTVARCGLDLVSHTTVIACMHQACVGGACKGVCSPGALQCADDINLQQCDTAGRWGTGTPCTIMEAGAACQAGSCVGVCAPGTVQSCADSTHAVVCDATGQWATGACPPSTPLCLPSLSQCICDGYVSGGSCIAPTLLAAGSQVYLALDSTSIYWTQSTTSTCTGDGGSCDYNHDGAVAKMPLAGGSVTTLASGLDFPTFLRVDSANAYWLDEGPYLVDAGATGAVTKVPLGGGAATRLGAPVTGGQGFLVTDAFDAYWTPNTTVLQQPLDGGAVATIATSPNPFGVAVDSTYVYWADEGTPPSYTDGAILRVPIAGGTPQTLASGLAHPMELTVDSTSAYFNLSGAGLLKVPLAGGTPTTLVAALVGLPVLEAGNVYFTSWDASFTNQTIMAVPVAGGTPATLATLPNQAFVQDLAVDAANVCWTQTTTSPGIWRIPRP